MTKKCVGCGVELQNTDKNLQGYTPKPINTKEDMYCQRCFQLKHYGKYSVNKMTREDYKKEVGKLLDDVKLVIAVFDIIDFEGSFDVEILDILREEMKEESFNVLRDRLMFELLYSSGMTVAELLSLGELNFNLEKREVYLLKNKISKVLYFSQTCKEVYLKFLAAKKEKFKEEDNSSIIFINNSNMRLTDRSIRRLINKYSEKANLQKEVSPYTLRHSFCLYMLENGMPKEYLAKLLDLKSIGLLDIYEDLCKKEILWRKNV